MLSRTLPERAISTMQMVLMCWSAVSWNRRLDSMKASGSGHWFRCLRGFSLEPSKLWRCCWIPFASVCQKKATQGDTTKKNVQKQRQTNGDKWNDSYQHLPTAPTTCHGDATKKHCFGKGSVVSSSFRRGLQGSKIVIPLCVELWRVHFPLPSYLL